MSDSNFEVKPNQIWEKDVNYYLVLEDCFDVPKFHRKVMRLEKDTSMELTLRTIRKSIEIKLVDLSWFAEAILIEE